VLASLLIKLGCMHGEMPLFSLQECLAKAKHFTELVMETIRLTKLIDSTLKFRV
jgi:hypothetical protein